MRFCLLLLLLMAQFWAGDAVAAASSIEGLWATQDKDAVVQIYSCDEDEFCGRFYWLKDEDPRSPSRDDNNPDEEKKRRLLCGLKFFGGFEDEGEGDYGSGWLYSPRHGARFSASIRLIDVDKLELRGFFVVPFLGESQIWTRTSNTTACPSFTKQ